MKDKPGKSCRSSGWALVLFAFGLSMTIAQQNPPAGPGAAIFQPERQPPGLAPVLFAPGAVSTTAGEGCSGWGTRMEYFIFQRWKDGKSRLYLMNRGEDGWSRPEPLSFAETYQTGDFTIAPDGQIMAFASNIPVKGLEPEGEGGNIWLVKKTETGWSTPELLPPPVNTKYHDSYPSLAANGNLYFFSRRPGGSGASDLYLSRLLNGKYQEPVNLGAVINTSFHEWDPYIAPDESYLIYCSMMPGGPGEDDLYISFRQADGSWGTPLLPGYGINTAKSENRPYVSPDGKCLFFTSTRNGNRDIFWMDAGVIEELNIRDRVERFYIKGLKSRDFSLIRAVCTPETVLQSTTSAGELNRITLDRWELRFDPARPPFQNLEYEIVQIDRSGSAAGVKIKFLLDRQRTVHDYLHLLKLNGFWKIVNIIDN